MNQLDLKINEHLPGLVIRKDLHTVVKGSVPVPNYVLEYLLGQFCATTNEDAIYEGVAKAHDILGKHFVHRAVAPLFLENALTVGRFRVIDRISISRKGREDIYEAQFVNLGLKNVIVDPETAQAHQRLLVCDAWYIIDAELHPGEDGQDGKWHISSLRPVRNTRFDFDEYVAARRYFSTDQWIDVLIQSIGLDPAKFGKRTKLLLLLRLIPLCERNFNLMNFGPKGTGKSYLYTHLSPHSARISGSKLTAQKLFANSKTRQAGLIANWDCVEVENFTVKWTRVDNDLRDGLKNYLATGSFILGWDMLDAEASIVFTGNMLHTIPFMLKHSHFFNEVPDGFYDARFLDRIHCFSPGWELPDIRSELLTAGYGFPSDYLAEAMRALRDHDYSDRYELHFTLSSGLSAQDREGINKNFSGLMKLLFPGGSAPREDIEIMLTLAMEGRKRVTDHIMRKINSPTHVEFAYYDLTGEKFFVTTLEEKEFPDLYRGGKTALDPEDPYSEELYPEEEPAPPGPGRGKQFATREPQEGHFVCYENQRGVSYDDLFGPYILGAGKITLTDSPYSKLAQMRNLMEFLETVIKHKPAGKEVAVHLVTHSDEFAQEIQLLKLNRLQDSARPLGVSFSFEFDGSKDPDTRHIITDTGWNITLDCGLGIFQPFEAHDSFSFANRLQHIRSCKAFEITYARAGATALPDTTDIPGTDT